MVAALVCIAFVQQDLPKTYDEVLSRMKKAYRELTNYADTWELSDASDTSVTMRFQRRIDGDRCWLRATAFHGGAEDPLFEEGANGKEKFMIVFPTKSYFRGKDDGSFHSDGGPDQLDKGSLNLGLTTYEVAIQCRPTPTLTSIKTVAGTVGGGRIAVAEAYNPDTKNRATLTMSFLNRWWLLSDVTATIHFADGTQNVLKLHPRTLMMNAKLPPRAFDLTEAEIKGFKKKTLDEIGADARSIGRH